MTADKIENSPQKTNVTGRDREPLAHEDGDDWRTAKLHISEVEGLVRTPTRTHIDAWLRSEDVMAYGPSDPDDTESRRAFANQRLEYLGTIDGIAPRLEEIERDTW